MPETNEKVAVVAIEIPWENVDCIGIFGSFEEANEAARNHTDSFFRLTGGGEYSYEPIDGFGQTAGTDGDWSEGYEFLFLEAPFDGCYVKFEDRRTGDCEIKGPYHDHDEANQDLFGPKARKRFVCVPGTFGMGFYPVERREGRYVYLPIYGE